MHDEVIINSSLWLSSQNDMDKECSMHGVNCKFLRNVWKFSEEESTVGTRVVFTWKSNITWNVSYLFVCVRICLWNVFCWNRGLVWTQLWTFVFRLSLDFVLWVRTLHRWVTKALVYWNWTGSLSTNKYDSPIKVTSKQVYMRPIEARTNKGQTEQIRFLRWQKEVT
jgi:hypothetical protein